MELFVDLFDMGMNGMGADREFVAELIIGEAAFQTAQDLLFSRAEQVLVIVFDALEFPDDSLGDYGELIEYFCDFAFFKPRHKVNPDFIRALILAESAGDPKAISHKDARGLGQILPETGRIAGRELFGRQEEFQYVSRQKLKDIQAQDLHDPALNILLTCYLIAKYNYQYDGKLQLVVSAWNAGENAIENNQPPNYRETLELIGKVNGYFRFLLKQKEPS